MDFQKQLYEDINERTGLECRMAEKIKDYDLKDHIAQLEAYHIKGNNDFMAYPLKDVDEDFVTDLLYRYLQDVKQRVKAGEFGRANSATLLRKCIRLTDIDNIIVDLQKKSNNLLLNAGRLKLKLQQEAKQKEVRARINKLAHNPLEFRANEAKKRSNSICLKAEGLFSKEYEFEELHRILKNPNLEGGPRPDSGGKNRGKLVKKIPRKHGGQGANPEPTIDTQS